MRVERFASVVALLWLNASGCQRSPMSDLPVWRVELDGDGREVRLVHLPFEQTSYDLRTHQRLKVIQDRNQDGRSDRIVVYAGQGEARSVETDADFDGHVDRWETFGVDGQRRRSATSDSGDGRPTRVATYGSGGILALIEMDANRDGRFEITQVFENRRLAETRIDSDGSGRVDRVQDHRPGHLASEVFDNNEDGIDDFRMTYSPTGVLLKVEVLQSRTAGAIR